MSDDRVGKRQQARYLVQKLGERVASLGKPGRRIDAGAKANLALGHVMEAVVELWPLEADRARQALETLNRQFMLDEAGAECSPQAALDALSTLETVVSQP